MQPHTTSLADVVRFELDRHGDERGSFARLFCRDTFAALGLHCDFIQSSISTTARRGTIRGMHYQRAPHGETKLVRCARGAIYDVLVDMRAGSPTHGRWEAFELTPGAGDLLYIPEGIAHGFQTLTDDAEVSYSMDRPYHAEAASGVRFDDPVFAISWPLPVSCISVRDRGWELMGSGKN